jgi:hypothetical protein
MSKSLLKRTVTKRGVDPGGLRLLLETQPGSPQARVPPEGALPQVRRYGPLWVHLQARLPDLAGR